MEKNHNFDLPFIVSFGDKKWELVNVMSTGDKC